MIYGFSIIEDDYITNKKLYKFYNFIQTKISKRLYEILNKYIPIYVDLKEINLVNYNLRININSKRIVFYDILSYNYISSFRYCDCYHEIEIDIEHMKDFKYIDKELCKITFLKKEYRDSKLKLILKD